MKYLDKRFSSPANSRAYVDNWEAVFGEKQSVRHVCPRTGNSAYECGCTSCRALVCDDCQQNVWHCSC